ncbi:MAG: hypothetical protein AAGB13_08760 [Cyanobacteria bacterium P01_F01_bin.33]
MSKPSRFWSRQGGVSFRMLFYTMNMIHADWDAWVDRAASIAAYSPLDVEAGLFEMIKTNTGNPSIFQVAAPFYRCFVTFNFRFGQPNTRSII